MLKTSEEIQESLKQNIAYENPKIDLASGNVARDVGVDAFSAELAALYTEQDRVRRLFLLDASAFSDSEADMLASSYNLYRLQATYATGTVIFGSTDRPESGSTYVIPAGTVVTTSGQTQTAQTYITLTTAYITSATVQNPVTGYYEVSADVKAQVSGKEGNVGQGTINQITSTVNNVAVCYNPDAITNGTDKETTAELIERIRLKARGAIYGTVASYLSKVYEDPRVLDAVVVDPDNEFSVRGPGTVDIYVLGNESASTAQYVSDTSQKTVQLSMTPIKHDSLKPVTVILDNGTVLSENEAFSIYSDDSSEYAFSSKAKDRLVWTDQAYDEYIRTAQSYTINYSYNRLITDLQATFDSDDYRILTSDVLLRDTHEIQVEIEFYMITLPNYDFQTVKTQVINNIETFVNSFTLNMPLRQSDIIGIVENTEGVDYMKFPMVKFCVLNGEGVADIEASPLSYIRISTENIRID